MPGVRLCSRDKKKQIVHFYGYSSGRLKEMETEAKK